VTSAPHATPAGAFAVCGRLVLEGRACLPGVVVVQGGKIVELRRERRLDGLPPGVHEAAYVSPGFIDLQVNGGFGVEVGDDAEDLRHLAEQLPATGVTAFLPTMVSSPLEAYGHAERAFRAEPPVHGALPLGLHFEGPFLSPRRSGAHRPAAIENAPDALFESWLVSPYVRLVTLAPETEGALARVRRLRERGIVVSLGHTDATYEQFVRGVDAGATLVTHVYSAMSGFQHRAPGAVGAALTDDRVTVGLIADGIHCHPAAVALAVRAKGAERVALVTDAIAGAGMGPGIYTLDGQEIHVDESAARLPDGTLAGSVLHLDQAVRNVVAWTGLDVAAACRMASTVPARVLGLENKGRLAPGCDADLALFDEQLGLQATFREGRCLYRR
jgi:N-acetylglucosamine-6-phosphate deacetylase